MDADILRLVLFLAGVGLILGIYFWDRHKKINLRVNAIHKAEQRQREKSPPSGKPELRQEPVWDNEDDEDSVSVAPDDLTDRLKELGDIVEEKRAEKKVLFTAEQTAFEFSQSNETASVIGKQDRQVPQKILQLNIMTKNRAISGDALMRAARDLKLEHGEMEIFHRYMESGSHKPVFSMASLVEPGTFPLDAMAGFTTPGVTLFAQLPGPLGGLETFEQMLATAQRLAALLDAELLDQTRSVLSRQTIEHIKEEINEHSRLVRIARSR